MLRNFLTLLLALFASTLLLAQTAPMGMKYQAVARDLSANVLAAKTIALQIDLLLGAEDDAVVYSERHKVTTNQLGLFTLAIGEGQSQGASLAEVPWSSADIWMRVRIKDDRSGEFTTISNSKMLSVPYAFYATTAGEVEGGMEGEKNDNGVPSSVWSTFGNTRTNPEDDKLGTMDCADLVLVTDSQERLRILCSGEIDIDSDLSIGNDLNVENNANVGNDLTVNNNTDLDGTLNVDGQTDLNSDVNVNNNSTTNLSGDVNVDGATDLNNTLNVDGQTNLNSDVNVNNNSTTNLSGDLNVDGNTDLNVDLNVDGETNLNSDVNVNNNSTTNLGGDVNVDGNTDLNVDLNVDGTTNLNSDFSVNNNSTTTLSGEVNIGGVTTVSASFNVNGGNTTNLTGPVNVDGATTLNSTLTVNESTVLESTLSVNGATNLNDGLTVAGCIQSGGGVNESELKFCPDINLQSSESVDNYPLQIRSGSQGIAIELDLLGPDYSYVSFFHPEKGMRGQIKSRNGFLGDVFDRISVSDLDAYDPEDAQGGSDEATAGRRNRVDAARTAGEAEVDYDEITNRSLMLDQGELVELYNLSLAFLADGIELVTSITSVLDPLDIFEAALSTLVSGVDLGTFVGFSIANIGVAYESGSGDYAEWLEKGDHQENLMYGDVVGVIGGKVSKEFTDADQFMVVSAAPAVIGAMPADGVDQSNFATIAFMGQVPVKVRGEVKVSDFILPSGDGDGLAIAVNRQEMRAGDYGRIIGVAWHDSDPEQAKKLYQMINVAVGINQNDMAQVIEGMQSTMNAMQASLAKLDPDFQPSYYDADAPVGSPLADMTVSRTNSRVMAGYFEGKTYETREELGALVVEALEDEAGLDLSQRPAIKRILLDPEFAERSKQHYLAMINTYTQWAAELNAN